MQKWARPRKTGNSEETVTEGRPHRCHRRTWKMNLLFPNEFIRNTDWMKSCPYALNNISDRCKQGFYDHHADGSTATNMPQAHSLLDLTVDLQGHFFSFRPPGQLLVTQICVHREISSLTKADQKLNQHYEKKCLCCLRTKQEHTRLLQEHTEGIQNIRDHTVPLKADCPVLPTKMLSYFMDSPKDTMFSWGTWQISIP